MSMLKGGFYAKGNITQNREFEQDLFQRRSSATCSEKYRFGTL